MALAGKLEENIEIKASANEFYKMLCNEGHRVPKATNSVHAVQVHEGDWASTGSVKLWTYTIDGKQETFKEKVEHDVASKTMTVTAVEGHVLEKYKSFKGTFQIIPKGRAAAIVKVIVEYEKFNATDPPPRNYMDWVVNLVKDVDAHLVKA